MSLPHDLGTWGFILSVAALLLAIPLGIAATLLAPRLQVWWFVRSVRGSANKLLSLSAYHDRLAKEPLFSPTEALLFEQQLRLMYAVHYLAYVLVLAVVFTHVRTPGMPSAELARRTGNLITPVLILIIGSTVYFGMHGLKCLRNSSPKGRGKTEEEIARLVEKLSKTKPPR
jgi:hypothetical protein